MFVPMMETVYILKVDVFDLLRLQGRLRCAMQSEWRTSATSTQSCLSRSLLRPCRWVRSGALHTRRIQEQLLLVARPPSQTCILPGLRNPSHWTGLLRMEHFSCCGVPEFCSLGSIIVVKVRSDPFTVTNQVVSSNLALMGRNSSD